MTHKYVKILKSALLWFVNNLSICSEFYNNTFYTLKINSCNIAKFGNKTTLTTCIKIAWIYYFTFRILKIDSQKLVLFFEICIKGFYIDYLLTRSVYIFIAILLLTLVLNIRINRCFCNRLFFNQIIIVINDDQSNLS